MLSRFLQYLSSERRYSPLTVRNYRRDVERFFAWLGLDPDGFDPERIASGDVREWMVVRTERDKLGAASMNRELSSLRAFFRYLHNQGEISKDLFHAVGALRAPKRLPVFVPRTRMADVLRTCDAKSGSGDPMAVRDALLVVLLYTCGLRLSELVGINRDDFSADFTSLRVRGKGDKERLVPVLDFVREKIIAYLSLVDGQNICKSGEKALFLTHKGVRISRTGVYRAVRAQLAGSGVQGKCSPHVLRHTFATHLLDGGADMREIQELLGHASLQATQVYTHNSIGRLQEVYGKAHPRGSETTK